MKLRAPPVKEAAVARGLEVYQPTRVRNGELAGWLEALQVDVALVAAYGRILPPEVLATPTHGCLNLHASILPAYRGAAPIQWAIANGDTETGVSLMRMDAGMDTGPVYAVRRLPIPEHMNSAELTLALSELGAGMVGDEFLAAVDGTLHAEPQDEARATAAPPIRKEHLPIDWALPRERIVNQVRAFAPAPGAFTYAGQRRLKLLEARVGESGKRGEAGEVIGTHLSAALIACADGVVELWRAGAEGKNPQLGRDLVNGRLLEVGQRLGPEPSAPA
jgi:methionyl-tRNA formyltransferase